MIPAGHDYDGPVYTLISRRTHVARKVQGPCSVCGWSILPGDRYHAAAYSSDDGLIVDKAHAVCEEP